MPSGASARSSGSKPLEPVAWSTLALEATTRSAPESAGLTRTNSGFPEFPERSVLKKILPAASAAIPLSFRSKGTPMAPAISAAETTTLTPLPSRLTRRMFRPPLSARRRKDSPIRPGPKVKGRASLSAASTARSRSLGGAFSSVISTTAVGAPPMKAVPISTLGLERVTETDSVGSNAGSSSA